MKNWSPFEDLSEYEKEEVNIKPATPPVAKKLYTIGTRASVVHGVPCQRPMSETIQDARMWESEILGTRWLLGRPRREGKITSSVVVFFNRAVYVGPVLKMRGKKHSVAAYDWDRGRRYIRSGVYTQRRISLGSYMYVSIGCGCTEASF